MKTLLFAAVFIFCSSNAVADHPEGPSYVFGSWARYRMASLAHTTKDKFLDRRGDFYKVMIHRVRDSCPGTGYDETWLVASVERKGYANYVVRGWIYYTCK